MATAAPLVTQPVIRVKELAKYLAGERHCDWALWYRSNNPRYVKHPSESNFLQWTAEHTQLVRQRVAALESDGYLTMVEHQNNISIPGHFVVLKGRPDIVAVKGDAALIVDCKTGMDRISDRMQVLLYLELVPRARKALMAGKRLAGEVYYKGAAVESVNQEEFTREIRELVNMVARTVAQTEPPRATPSWAECRYCDVGGCASRVRAIESEGAERTNWF